VWGVLQAKPRGCPFVASQCWCPCAGGVGDCGGDHRPVLHGVPDGAQRGADASELPHRRRPLQHASGTASCCSVAKGQGEGEGEGQAAGAPTPLAIVARVREGVFEAREHHFGCDRECFVWGKLESITLDATERPGLDDSIKRQLASESAAVRKTLGCPVPWAEGLVKGAEAWTRATGGCKSLLACQIRPRRWKGVLRSMSRHTHAPSHPCPVTHWWARRTP